MDFKNLKGLMKHLSDEGACQTYMEQMRWGGTPRCAHCQHPRPYRLKDGKTFRCSSRFCRKDFTVTVGTVFEGSKVSCSNWMTALYLLVSQSKGISSVQLGKHLGVTQKTAWFILHRLRLILAPAEAAPFQNVVEVDETYVGGKVGNMTKKKRQKHIEEGIDNKTPVMGFYERPDKEEKDKTGKGKVKMTVIGKHNFKEVVRKHVTTQAILMTDNHMGYRGLDIEYAAHATINHNEGEFKRGDIYTNSIEGFFGLFKRVLHGTYHQVSPKHLQKYCDEVTHRFNSRDITDRQRFDRALSCAKGRLTYNQLIKNQ